MAQPRDDDGKFGHVRGQVAPGTARSLHGAARPGQEAEAVLQRTWDDAQAWAAAAELRRLATEGTRDAIRGHVEAALIEQFGPNAAARADEMVRAVEGAAAAEGAVSGLVARYANEVGADPNDLYDDLAPDQQPARPRRVWSLDD